jgi:hypothetical protein
VKTIQRIITATGLIAVMFAFIAMPVYAAKGDPCDLSAGSGAPNIIPTWYSYVPGEVLNDECVVASNLGGKLPVLILMGVFDILLFIGGFIAVIMIMFAGYKFLASTGEPQKIAGARTTLFNALVGLAITIVASQIIGFIAGRLA